MKTPAIIPIASISHELYANYAILLRKGCFPPRPKQRGDLKRRIKCAWLVFTGQGDVLLWKD